MESSGFYPRFSYPEARGAHIFAQAEAASVFEIRNKSKANLRPVGVDSGAGDW